MGLEDSVSKKKAPTKSMSSGKPDLAVAAPGANGASSQHSDVLAEGQEGSPTQELADIAAETQLLSDERMDDVDDDRPPNIPNTTPSRQPQRPVITTGPRSKRGPAAVKSEEAETKAQGADDKDRGMHDVTAEDLERLRAAPHAGYLQGLPEGMALQLQQMWNRSSRSSSGAPASSAPQAMLASMLQPPGSSGLPPKGSSSQMQQGSGGGSLMGSGGLSGVNPALLQQAVAAGHISVPQLVQMGMVPGMQVWHGSNPRSVRVMTPCVCC